MKVWIHINGVQEGPYELENLPLDRMSAETPVWYEGLPDWMAASDAPLIAPMMHCQQAATPVDVSNAVGVRGVETSADPDAPKEPSSYLAWSIIMTVICCNPIAIIPIITGVNVRSKYRNRNYQSAERWSETTAWWVMIAIVTSLMLAPLVLLAQL